ncbi:MAG: hypothetical protein R3E79_16175 [Caldilineaceae bacterium]
MNILLAILLVLVGLLMILRPAIIWSITESWKSADATEPSDVYSWATRFGGILCTLAGLGAIVAYTIL